MAYSSIPWPAVAGSPTYSADDFKAMLKGMAGVAATPANSGVLYSAAGGLRVYANNPASMVIHVEPGMALLNGLFAASSAVVDLTVDPADPTYTRYDRVVFRSDSTTPGSVSVALKKGTAGPAPTEPALDQTGAPYYEIPLAQVIVGPAATSLSQPVLRSERIPVNLGEGETQLCIATGTVAYGNWLCWDAPQYPTSSGSLDGYHFNRVAALNSGNYHQPVAGIALASGSAGSLIPVLRRGVWESIVMTSFDVNTFDLLRPYDSGTGENTLRPYTVDPPAAMALQWVRSPATGTRIMVYVDPAGFYSVPAKVGVVSVLTGNVTNNTAGSWSDISVVAQQTLYTRGRYAEVFFKAAVSNGGAGNRTKFTFQIDGVDQAVQWDEAAPVAGYRQMVTLHELIDLAALGVTPINALHTFKIRWQPSAGTSTLYCAAGEVPPAFWVKEVL